MEAENSYAETATKHTAELQQKLYNEFISHLKEDDIDVSNWSTFSVLVTACFLC